ncbi:MAG: hypothetical protein IJC54_01995 [Clostridia bacterium]|nr:hypothetical protein [Clostridia bacterium]MBQ4085327.1 hypothetical protein [Clostridia bacterium]
MSVTNAYIENWIRDYMDSDERNSMRELPGRAFDLPLVGFSSAQDELYPFYKQHISPEFYRLPQEWLEMTFGKGFDPAEVSVISWVLPQTEENRIKSRAEEKCPPLEWQMVRVHGEECNRSMAKELAQHLCSLGFEAVAPMCSDAFSWGQSERFGPISNWSERHTALISGLGTFGLCDGLISKKGKAARYGSVIVHCRLEPTARDYTAYNEYCMAKNGCTACIRRCPAGAITPEGHDKAKCIAYHQQVIKTVCHDRDNYDGYAVCGLCQTGVPCECGIPGRENE